MSLSVVALAVVMAALPRRYALLAGGAGACAVVAFVGAFVLAGPSPAWSSVALVVGANSSGLAAVVVVEGLSASLSFAPPAIYLTSP